MTASETTTVDTSETTLHRCEWALTPPLMTDYHDREWGVPVHDDRQLFELLILEGARAGLSWSTILNKREGYRTAFWGFDPDAIAAFTPDDVDQLLTSASIVRNRAKIQAAVGNARAFRVLIDDMGSFDRYVWGFVGGRPLQNSWPSIDAIPAQTEESRALSADLRRRGFRFVGPTICYAFMQSAGLVNDHVVSCYRYADLLGS